MLSILQKEYDSSRQKGGRPPKLTVEDKLYVTLKYLREYRTTGSIAADYHVCKGTVCQSVQWAGDTLTEDGTFALPGKKKLKRKSDPVRYVVAGVTESPVNRPKKGQKEYYSEKKRHTLKTQAIIERNSPRIIDAQEVKGGEHDFKIFKDTVGKGISNSIPAGADSGYQGIKEYHANSYVPVKSSKNIEQV